MYKQVFISMLSHFKGSSSVFIRLWDVCSVFECHYNFVSLLGYCYTKLRYNNEYIVIGRYKSFRKLKCLHVVWNILPIYFSAFASSHCHFFHPSFSIPLHFVHLLRTAACKEFFADIIFLAICII